MSPMRVLSGGIGKRFFHDKFQVRVNLNDGFHSDIMLSKIVYQNINADFERVYDSQFFRIHLTYNFGKKTVSRTQPRKSGVEDEQNRIKTQR